MNIQLDISHARPGVYAFPCWLTIGDESYNLQASTVIPPFEDLFFFLRAVAGQRLPYKFYWDEEGNSVIFEAWPVAEDSPLARLKITDDPDTPWIDAVLPRQAIIQAFLPPLLELVRKFPNGLYGWPLPSLAALEQVQRASEQGIPLRSDVQAAKQVEFTLAANYEPRRTGNCTTMRMLVEEDPICYHEAGDADPFWPEWLEFLAKIARADLPAQITLVMDSLRFAITSQDEQVLYCTTRMQAEALDHPDNFRLRIFITEYGESEEFLRFDEVIARRQMVRAFTAPFEIFLAHEYQARPDPSGVSFDLRTLQGSLP